VFVPRLGNFCLPVDIRVVRGRLQLLWAFSPRPHGFMTPVSSYAAVPRGLGRDKSHEVPVFAVFGGGRDCEKLGAGVMAATRATICRAHRDGADGAEKSVRCFVSVRSIAFGSDVPSRKSNFFDLASRARNHSRHPHESLRTLPVVGEVDDPLRRNGGRGHMPRRPRRCIPSDCAQGLVANDVSTVRRSHCLLRIH
jgi:hypothetical protein